MAAEVCQSLKSMVDQATDALIRQPQTEVTDLSFATLDEEITKFTPTSQELLFLPSVRTKLGPAPRLQGPTVGNVEDKPPSRKIGN